MLSYIQDYKTNKYKSIRGSRKTTRDRNKEISNERCKMESRTHKCTQIIKDTEKNVQNSFKEEQSNHKTRGENTTKK